MNDLFETPSQDMHRLAFPRGRFFTKLEDDLTVFVQLIDKCSGLEIELFNIKFDQEYRSFHDSTDKTVANHRTEMITLFGLTVIDDQGLVWPSGNSKTLLETQDFPLFFKAFCNKFQFPNRVNVWSEAVRQAQLGVKFKPAPFILQIFQEAAKQFPGQLFYASGAEISNLVFNDLRVATGRRTPQQVVEAIISARKNEYVFPSGSNPAQHGREFLSYMTLARLLKSDDTGKNFYLNTAEVKAINHIIQNKSYVPFTGLDDEGGRRRVYEAWDQKYKTITLEETNAFRGRHSKLGLEVEANPGSADVSTSVLKPNQQSLNETGDEGEMYVLKREKELVGAVRLDKVALVARVANDTSLGYDIQSLELPSCDRKKYIEVKSTIRTFPPSKEILTFFPMSGNEWETARQYKDSYYIYRVVLLADEVLTYIIQNPVKKESNKEIILEVKEYRVVLKHDAVDDVYSMQR